jgi:hypothetical protein
VRPGGAFLVAHFEHDLAPLDRLVLDLWLRWTPHFRKPREIARLLGRTSAQGAASAAGLVRGPNVYLSVERRR